MSHLGLEPQGGTVGRHGTRAGRLLFQLVLDEFKDELVPTPASAYMKLAVYDLIGEIFTPSDANSASPYTDKQFGRVRAFIEERFADPDLRPRDVAAEAGISLLYLQKLFTQRGSTCRGFIDSLRLDHAGRLLQRRRWRAHASLSARSPTPAVLTIIVISHKSFAYGSVMHRAPMPETVLLRGKIIESLG
jgi:AraC-like DNA-binding protein